MFILLCSSYHLQEKAQIICVMYKVISPSVPTLAFTISTPPLPHIPTIPLFRGLFHIVLSFGILFSQPHSNRNEKLSLTPSRQTCSFPCNLLLTLLHNCFLDLVFSHTWILRFYNFLLCIFLAMTFSVWHIANTVE